ncbi:FAD-dependent monooxygenase [Palleronia sp. KMU-117]|uniref:FAD-dependent monooxygenase n=1 Tax=Palleronia sp. KMU-117 TaxID=3434108 RepID=UPI003D742AEB
MSDKTDILIAGGGLNGTALAIALGRAGLRVTLVDPLPAETRGDRAFDGRGYALALSSQRLLAAIGVWREVAAQSQPILHITVSDGRAGEGASPLALEFDHAEIEEAPMGHMVEDRVLRPALLAALAGTEGVTHLPGVSVADHTATGPDVAVTLSDGRRITAELLVACDGKQSPTATRAGIGRMGWAYGQTALVCAVEHDKPHNGTAHQFFMPPGPLAILPLPGNRSSIVWTERHATAGAIAGLDDAGYLAALRPRFGDFLGEIRLAGARFTYPLSLSVAERFVGDRLALAGDAAHAVHPIAGQGLNAGLKDVAALAEVLVEARRRGEDIGRVDVLRRYERWRRFDTMTLAIATDAFNRLFSNDSSILRLGRDLGLGLVGRLPGLRRGFIREAAGLTGDLPRLSRGLPL